MNVETFTAPGFEQNAYIAWTNTASEAVAIDPGGLANAMADFLEAKQLTLSAVLLTHAHIDHIQGVGQLVRRADNKPPIYLHPDDRRFYDNAAVQAAQFGMSVGPLPPIDEPLSHGQRLVFGELSFRVRHAPGHSPGHVILVSEKVDLAFVGDVVFQRASGISQHNRGAAGTNTSILISPAGNKAYQVQFQNGSSMHTMRPGFLPVLKCIKRMARSKRIMCL